MVQEKSNRKYLAMFCFIITMVSCTNIYESSISNILHAQNVSIVSSKRYESHAVGEWYILERYILSGDTKIQLEVNRDIKDYGIKKHPTMEGYYWIGWNPVSLHSATRNILTESARFYSNNSLVSEYDECCHNDDCYYTILVRDSAELFNDLYEKTAVVFDQMKNTIYICNYHY